jgi:N-acetylmuramoyl-L-alanine amidase
VKPEATASKPKKEGAEEPKKSPTEKYAIQIMSSKEPINTSAESFKKIGLPVSRTKLTTTAAYKYLYTVGSYATKESAKVDLKTVQSNGFKDAYVVKIE